MDKLFKKIYEEIIYYEKETVEADRRISDEIDGLCVSLAEKLTKEETGKLKGFLCRVSLTAQEEGFLLGMKYMWKLSKFLDTDLKNLENS